MNYLLCKLYKMTNYSSNFVLKQGETEDGLNILKKARKVEVVGKYRLNHIF